MTLHEKTLQWAKSYLLLHEKSTLRHRIVVETSYSVVYQLETTHDVFYVKQVPKALFLESQTVRFLNQHGCKNIPEIIAENAELNCFMMKACGTNSLRHLFNGDVNVDQLQQGILNYTNIQRLLESKIQTLLSLGILDWRLTHFPGLYEKLIQQDDLLIEDGLTTKEVEQLHQHYPTVVKLCTDLASYKIPETLSHCDFQFNNMLLDKKTGEITIIDWAETVISHPFFSLNGCLWNLTYFNVVKQTEQKYAMLQSACIAPWVVDYQEISLLKAFDLANQLLGIHAALAFQRIYRATQDQQKTVKQEHPGSIAGCLRTFLKAGASDGRTEL
jgi:hypothetical protein